MPLPDVEHVQNTSDNCFSHCMFNIRRNATIVYLRILLVWSSTPMQCQFTVTCVPILVTITKVITKPYFMTSTICFLEIL